MFLKIIEKTTKTDILFIMLWLSNILNMPVILNHTKA
jgi:hypothetical protein